MSMLDEYRWRRAFPGSPPGEYLDVPPVYARWMLSIHDLWEAAERKRNQPKD